jgi:hypothetical protein
MAGEMTTDSISEKMHVLYQQTVRAGASRLPRRLIVSVYQAHLAPRTGTRERPTYDMLLAIGMEEVSYAELLSPTC